MPDRTSGPPHPLKTWVMVLLITALVAACYLPALRGSLLWDDPAHVPRPELRSWHGLWRIWTDLEATQQYYPVLFTAFWVEHRLWGDATVGYHLTNVLLHAASCCLLAVALGRLWSEPDPSAPGGGRRVPAGAEWLAAALLAVHPVCVETVAWITEQKNTLSLFFFLLAGLAYLDFAVRRRATGYALASVLFLLALGSKTTTVVLPPLLLVVLWWRQGRLAWRRDLLPLLPWFVLSAAAGLLTSWVERHVIGAEGAAFHFSLFQRTMLAGRVVWFYLGKLVWPAGLNFFYPRWDVPAAATGWIAGFAALVAVTVLLWVLRRRSRGPLAAWLFYLGALFPVMGFFNVFFFKFSFVNDHFQYIASLGLVAAAAGGAALALARLPPALRSAGRVACGLVVIGLAALAHAQSGLYRDNETLFRATIARNPDSWMAHHILAVTLSKAPDRHAEAIAEYEAALRLNPAFPDSHFGLGVELARLPGRKADAIAEYEEAVRLRPIYAEAHNNLALELENQPGRAPEALAHFEMALQVKPSFAEAHANLADVLAKLPGRQAEAIDHYEMALRLKPDLAWVHCHLAFVLAALPGRTTEALAHYDEALRLQPDNVDALNGLAIACVRMGRIAEARARWEAALRIAPGDEMIRNNLRLLDQMEGR